MAEYAPGMRTIIRDEEWMIKQFRNSSSRPTPPRNPCREKTKQRRKSLCRTENVQRRGLRWRSAFFLPA